MSQSDETLAAAQRRHWQATYTANPGMYGDDPSRPAQESARIFATLGVTDVLELGAGHGRDSLHFLSKGHTVTALDFSDTGLTQLRAAAEGRGLADRLTTTVHDVRRPLPLPDESVDAVYAHMLLCMALSTDELRTLMAEIHRVTRPGGVCVYTVRHTGDTHYGTGTAHGDGIYEHGGFAVHYFDEDLVNELAKGWRLRAIRPFSEGELPRRLWRVTQIRTDAALEPRTGRVCGLGPYRPTEEDRCRPSTTSAPRAGSRAGSSSRPSSWCWCGRGSRRTDSAPGRWRSCGSPWDCR